MVTVFDCKSPFEWSPVRYRLSGSPPAPARSPDYGATDPGNRPENAAGTVIPPIVTMGVVLVVGTGFVPAAARPIGGLFTGPSALQ
jgi:hypothetical protein